MGVSKRLRFEILRRDNHTCRYCGRSAPEVKLTIDHVVPESLGGTDDPDNLVAACPDCNSGKSSSSPDASVVADVSQSAMRWAAAMQQAAAEKALHDNTEVYEAVVKAWTSYRRNQIPADYRETIDRFLNAGLPADDIVAMVHVADAKPSIYNRWSYFCGCCWTRIGQLQERAAEILAAEAEPVEEEYEYTALFEPTPESQLLHSLFNQEPRRDTCFGYVTDAEYEKHAAVERAKWQARRDCTFCDNIGYRPNGYVCDHIDHDAENSAREEVMARIRAQREADA